MDEQELCQKKLIDLSCQANRKGIVLFSDFLNLNEQDILHRSAALFETRTECFGGVPFAERVMAAFVPDALYYEWEYPIAALHIVPKHPKFAGNFGHRDVLGALMQLGIDRAKIGDIIVGEAEAWFFCEERIADYVAEQFGQVRNAAVRTTRTDPAGIEAHTELREQEGIVSSNRLDAVIACVYRLSRSQAQELLRREKVFGNGKLLRDASYACHEGEIISVRGYGRFIYGGCCGETGKGRMRIRYKMYI